MLRNADVAVGVGGELAAQVHVGLGRVLVLVETLGRGLPDIDLGADHRLAVAVLGPGVDEQLRSRRRRADDRTAVLGARRIEPPERSQQVRRRFGRAVLAVVEQAHQGRHPERARRQHRLVVERIGALADRIDDGAGLMEFLFGQLHLADERMQVLDQRRHHLAEARVGRTRDLGKHRLGDVVRTLDDHGFLPLYSFGRIDMLAGTIAQSPAAGTLTREKCRKLTNGRKPHRHPPSPLSADLHREDR